MIENIIALGGTLQLRKKDVDEWWFSFQVSTNKSGESLICHRISDPLLYLYLAKAQWLTGTLPMRCQELSMFTQSKLLLFYPFRGLRKPLAK